jgi:hypothetical protein
MKWRLYRNGTNPGYPWLAVWPDGIQHSAATWDAAASFVWRQLAAHAEVQAEMAGFGRRGR